MSKKTNTRARKAQRSRAKQQRRTMEIVLSVGLILVIGGLILWASGGTATPQVDQARLDLDPVMGSPDAPVTMVEYSAFACPSCRALYRSGVLEEIVNEFDPQVKLVFRDFPVIVPSYDHMAAAVAQCALDQGNSQFWTYFGALYTMIEPSATTTQDDLVRLGGQVGLNVAELKSCADAGTHRATVAYDEQRGTALGLRGAPAIFINGQRAYSFDIATLRQMVQSALDAL